MSAIIIIAGMILTVIWAIITAFILLYAVMKMVNWLARTVKEFFIVVAVFIHYILAWIKE